MGVLACKNGGGPLAFTSTGMCDGCDPLAVNINVSSMDTSMFGVSMSPTLRGDAWAIAAARGNFSNSVEVLFLSHNVFSGFFAQSAWAQNL